MQSRAPDTWFRPGGFFRELGNKIQSKFPYSNHEFLQTCHFLCSNGGFHNAPSISPSAGLLTKQETSRYFKVTAEPPWDPHDLSSGGGVMEPLLSCLGSRDSRGKTSLWLPPPLPQQAALERTFVLAWRRRKKITRYRHVVLCSGGPKKRRGEHLLIFENVTNLIAFILTNTRNVETLLKTPKFKNYYCYYYWPSVISEHLLCARPC